MAVGSALTSCEGWSLGSKSQKYHYKFSREARWAAAGHGVAGDIGVFDGPMGASHSWMAAAVYRFFQTPDVLKENSNGNFE